MPFRSSRQILLCFAFLLSIIPSKVAAQVIPQSVDGFQFIACYIDNFNPRPVSDVEIDDYTSLTVEECATDCASYTYFGVEAGK